ncbi:PREDICTED: opsin-5-like [Corvus brachyrhynchos]|uniref:opsin-5-like n=1 Tax=Corvus brachyrhynchos TaxID=85066 RepID=UPI00081661B9|nr:PREDICTED: opsin-5-like [Corvus brachyrhynchos]
MSLEHLRAPHGVLPSGQPGLQGQMGNVSNTSVFTSTLSEREDLIFGTVYLVFGIMSLSGNSLLLLVAHQKRSLLKPAEFFISNLAISDLSMTVTLFPLAPSAFFAHRWLFDQAVCTLYAFCGVLFGLCSLASLTVLSTVCCLKVCYPAYGSRFSRSHAAVLLLAVWAYALAFATAPLAQWGGYGPAPDPSVWGVCQHPPSAAGVSWHHHLHLLLFQLSIAVCLGFLAAWTPYAVVALWALLGDASQVPALAFVLSAVFAKSSTLYNPLVYLLFKPSFHKFLSKDRVLLQALRALLCCGCWGAALQPSPSPAFGGRPGACRSCSDAFECFSNYPRCYTPRRAPGSSAQSGPLAVLAGGGARAAGNGTLPHPACPPGHPGPSWAILLLPIEKSLQKGTRG